jgi:hypothetical protein
MKRSSLPIPGLPVVPHILVQTPSLVPATGCASQPLPAEANAPARPPVADPPALPPESARPWWKQESPQAVNTGGGGGATSPRRRTGEPAGPSVPGAADRTANGGGGGCVAGGVALSQTDRAQSVYAALVNKYRSTEPARPRPVPPETPAAGADALGAPPACRRTEKTPAAAVAVAHVDLAALRGITTPQPSAGGAEAVPTVQNVRATEALAAGTRPGQPSPKHDGGAPPCSAARPVTSADQGMLLDLVLDFLRSRASRVLAVLDAADKGHTGTLSADAFAAALRQIGTRMSAAQLTQLLQRVSAAASPMAPGQEPMSQGCVDLRAFARLIGAQTRQRVSPRAARSPSRSPAADRTGRHDNRAAAPARSRSASATPRSILKPAALSASQKRIQFSKTNEFNGQRVNATSPLPHRARSAPRTRPSPSALSDGSSDESSCTASPAQSLLSLSSIESPPKVLRREQLEAEQRKLRDEAQRMLKVRPGSHTAHRTCTHTTHPSQVAAMLQWQSAKLDELRHGDAQEYTVDEILSHVQSVPPPLPLAAAVKHVGTKRVGGTVRARQLRSSERLKVRHETRARTHPYTRLLAGSTVAPISGWWMGV